MATIIRTGGGGKPEQSKSVTITQNGSQTVNPDAGHTLGSVGILVNVPAPSPELQSKTATPTGTQFTVSPDAGYDGLSSVVVSGDANLTAANIKEDVTIYGVTGTLIESQGIADKVPAEYASYAVAAEALVTAQGGSYDDILILENSSYIAIGFLTSGFEIQTYNSTTTEYTASGFWYAQYDKTEEEWTLYDYTETTSAGSSFLNNGVFTNTEIEYDSEVIFPVAKVESGGGGNSCTVVIHAPTGSTVTLTKGSTTLTATEVSGTWTFEVTEAGTWTATAVSGSSTFTGTVVVELSKDMSLVPKATVTGLGSSDTSLVIITKQDGFPSSFDEWTDANGNIFVKIPTMYRKITSIENNQITGFEICAAQLDSDFHPYSCFVAPDGITILPWVGIGKYCSNSSSVMNSVGGTPVANSIAGARNNARALGTGYQQYDWQLQKLFQDLAFINYGSVNFNSGRTISSYLGIYGLDVSIWVDGMAKAYSGYTWYYAKNPDNYVNQPTSGTVGYQAASYSAPSTGYISKLGYDANEEFFNFPSSTSSGSSSTYYCDYWETSWEPTIYSCVGASSAVNGLWHYRCQTISSCFARLCYRPISA